ncbi:MAG: hypothetical protein Kow00127_24320 [Bacteroidales bacterium]
MIKHLILLSFSLLMTVAAANAQKYITKTALISFYSETPVETIEAVNHQVNSALDTETGNFVFKVLMRSFEFEKALMQEHFNENYVESDKYPNATFTGKILNLSEIDFEKPGQYKAIVEGTLTIHGVSRQISEQGTLKVEPGVVQATSKFIIRPEDYKIRIPKTVINNIAGEIEVTVDARLEELTVR